MPPAFFSHFNPYSLLIPYPNANSYHPRVIQNLNGQDEDFGTILEVDNEQDGVDGQHEITPEAHIEVAEEDDDEIENGNVFNENSTLEEPTRGLMFHTKQDLQAYYKQYGKQLGFGVSIQRVKKDVDSTFKYLTLGCARGGKVRNRTRDVSKPRPTSKTECKAKINAMLVNGLWRITIVENAHNHGLSLQKSRYLRCHREIDTITKRKLDVVDRAGVRMNKSFNTLVVNASGFENLQFLEKDCRNYIDKAIQLRLGKGDAEALRAYFMRMQVMNDGFFTLMDLDDDLRLRNVFWADGRSRAVYDYFGDVVTFDTTYLTNMHGMPFAPFVGVNHHGQSILLGARLISFEDTNTFVWLFQTWLSCMNGKAPKTIITD
ncbi:hypothetical protein F2P56_030399 [Juglans regia]|uniref:Protein FAR1-RELATED SEQUENCE n=2 Tax=Juglans regia TaxID=51240 RepID=A0A833UDC5_JUGRE|nr:protein FAR-RED IMPAIRED RESPONSE 1-like [Juglans regia]KAF5450014.1 hypothetical protein F2P56_030399 [Juglans regia]